MNWRIADMVVEGDRVAVRLLDRGKPEDWLGLRPTGVVMEAHENEFYRYRDERFFNMWYLLDFQTTQQQLAAAPG